MFWPFFFPGYSTLTPKMFELILLWTINFEMLKMLKRAVLCAGLPKYCKIQNVRTVRCSDCVFFRTEKFSNIFLVQKFIRLNIFVIRVFFGSFLALRSSRRHSRKEQFQCSKIIFDNKTRTIIRRLLLQQRHDGVILRKISDLKGAVSRYLVYF